MFHPRRWRAAGAMIAAICVSLAFANAPTTVFASPSRPAAVASTETDCQQLLVQLNGNSPSTATCIQVATNRSSGLGNAGPKTGSGGCGNTVNLWVDAYQSGDEICFSGNGFADLPNYCEVWGPFICIVTWNDTATSWASHGQSGRFFSDVDGNGISMNYSTYRNGNFTSNPIPNDSLSSLCINSGCP